MKLIDFASEFPDEKSCREHFKQYRIEKGISCKRCQSREFYFLRGRDQFECKKCKSRQSLRSGTVMEHSNLPFRIWYIVMYFMVAGKKSFSALEVQRQCGHSRYEPIWYLMHKIRVAMGSRDDNYMLKTSVEIDEGFFETVISKQDNEEESNPEIKRGRGSQKQTKVLVMAESIPVGKVKKNQPEFRCGYFKMKVMTDLKSETINKIVGENIAKETVVRTDGYKGYRKLKNVVSSHIRMKIEPEKSGKFLPWVHISISNAKRVLLSTYHKQDQGYMQNYLNEFCYKTNRRYLGNKIFERLIIACVSFNWITY